MVGAAAAAGAVVGGVRVIVGDASTLDAPKTTKVETTRVIHPNLNRRRQLRGAKQDVMALRRRASTIKLGAVQFTGCKSRTRCDQLFSKPLRYGIQQVFVG